MAISVAVRPSVPPRIQDIDQRTLKPMETVDGLGGAFEASEGAPIDALTLSEPTLDNPASKFRGTGTYSLLLPGKTDPIKGTYEAIGFTAGPGSMLILRDGAEPDNAAKVKMISVANIKRDADGKVTDLLAFAMNMGPRPAPGTPPQPPQLFSLGR